MNEENQYTDLGEIEDADRSNNFVYMERLEQVSDIHRQDGIGAQEVEISGFI